MDGLKNKILSIRQKPVLFYGMGCLLLAVFSFLFVYYLRVIYSPSWLGQIKGSAVVFVFLLALSAAFVISSKLKEKNMPLFMALLLLVMGLVYAFATPPNQVPDEHTHFLRSYAMAQGQWGFDENHVYPDDVNSFALHFPTAHNNGYPAKEGNTVYNRFLEYFAAVESGEKAPNTGIIIFQVIPYIPGAIGIFLAKILGFGALGAFYAHRIANLVFFCFCSYFALKYAGKFKVIFFCLMAMPLMCFMYASCNSDSFLFALMFLAFSTVLAGDFDNKKLAMFTVFMAVLTVCKMSYIVFYPILLCVPKDRWKVDLGGRQLKKGMALAGCIVLFMVLYEGMSIYVQLFSNYAPIDRTMADSNPGRQLAFIISNPLRYAAVFFDTLKNNAFFLFSGGLLGWLDVNLPLISYLTPVIAILCCVKQANVFDKSDLGKTAVFFICSLLTYAVVLTGLYLSWTPVTLPQIIGLQMRYVYPAFLGFCMVIGQYFGARTAAGVKNTDYSCVLTSYCFSILGAVLMLIVYYLPERAVVFVA